MSNNHQSTESSTAAADSASRPTPRLWFVNEIQHMMHGFGDCRRPLAETAALVEEIVYRQLMELLYRAEEVAKERGAKNIGIEEFLFLLRKDKAKLKRILQLLEFRDIKAAVANQALEEDDAAVVEKPQILRKRLRVCYDFLKTIDHNGDLLSLFADSTEDEVKMQRKMRAELQSRQMDTEEYLEFCEARQASFTPRYKILKFKDWLMSGVRLELKLNAVAFEILSYIAYETVAEIVDFALIVKKDMSVTAGNPLGIEMAPLCSNLDAFTASSSSALSATHPTNMSPPSTPSSYTEPSTNSTVSKSKAKKRKLLGGNLSREIVTGNAITQTEVREALRRFLQPTGPFASFSKEPLIPITQRHFI